MVGASGGVEEVSEGVHEKVHTGEGEEEVGVKDRSHKFSIRLYLMRYSTHMARNNPNKG